MTPWRTKYLPLIEAVALKHGFSVLQLTRWAATRKISVARQEAIYTIWNLGALTLPNIGRMFDCDHTSVLYAVGAHMHRHNLEGKHRDAFIKRALRYKREPRAGHYLKRGEGGRFQAVGADHIDRGTPQSFGSRGVYAP